IREVQGTRPFDCRSQLRRATLYPCIHRPPKSTCIGSTLRSRSIGLCQACGNLLEFPGEVIQFTGGHLRRQPSTRLVSLFSEHRANTAERLPIVAPGRPEILDQQQQHVQFAHVTESSSDFSQTTRELGGDRGLELKNGEHFPEPP